MASRHRSRERALQVLYQWDMRRMPAAQGALASRAGREAPGEPEDFSVQDAFDGFYSSLSVDEGGQPGVRDPFMEELVFGAVRTIEDLDELIAARSDNWRLDRMPAVDRNILRLAVYEMTFASTPAAVVIDEALELAQRYSGENSVKFVNGVLDAIRKAAENDPGA